VLCAIGNIDTHCELVFFWVIEQLDAQDARSAKYKIWYSFVTEHATTMFLNMYWWEYKNAKKISWSKNLNSHPSPADFYGEHYKLGDKLFPVLRPRKKKEKKNGPWNGLMKMEPLVYLIFRFKGKCNCAPQHKITTLNPRKPTNVCTCVCLYEHAVFRLFMCLIIT